MTLFKDMLKSDESLFLNAVALDYDFMPKLIPYREQEQKQIATCIKPLFQKRNGRNLIITGVPGIGKTVACRHVLNELEEETDEIIPLYINCWQKNTTFKILVELCDQLGYKFTQNKKTDELFEVVKRLVNKKSVVFVFDEIDKAEDHDFLYGILEEVYRKTIILITNYKDWITSMDERVKSRLTAEMIEFRVYNSSETQGILAERMGFAFVNGVWADSAFNTVVEKAFALKDIRTGLYLMKEAGNMAEDRSSRKIESEDVEGAVNKLNEFSKKDKKELEDEDKKLIELVKGNPEITMGKLFELYQQNGGLGVYKTFQRKIAKLEKNGFINAVQVMGKEGNTKKISVNEVDKKLDEF